MHSFLKKKLPWYNQWHESWIHGPSHWVIFAFAVVTSTMLFTYVVNSAPGKVLIESAIPAARAGTNVQCENREAIVTACTCNGASVSSGYCCYNRVYPVNQSSIVHQSTPCGYTEVSPHYPSGQTDAHGNIYFAGGWERKNNPPGTTLPGTNLGQDWTNWAKQYDIIFNIADGNGVDDSGYDAMVRYNPSILTTMYETGNELDCVLESDYFCAKYHYMEQRAQDDGISFESLFLHFRKNTTITASGQTRNFKGWNPADDQGQCGGTANDGINDRITSCGLAASDAQATARTLFEARTPYGYNEYWRNNSSSPYYPQDWRWRVNSTNSNYRQYNADWYAKLMNDATGRGKNYAGIFVDNMQSDPYSGNVEYELEGGNVNEVANTAAWLSGLASTLDSAKTSLNAIGKKLYINAGTAEYWYNGFAGHADGYVREWLLKGKTSNMYTEWRFLNNLVPQVNSIKNTGQEMFMHFTYETSWDDAGTGGCFQGYTLSREKMWSWATYQLVNYSGGYFFGGYKTWDGYWFNGMTADIGTPSGDYFVWKTGQVDSAGKTYKIYRRNFSNGMVLVRFYEGPEGYCPGANVSATSSVPLDASDIAVGYKNVALDGTIGAANVTAVSLGIADGMVLQKAASCSELWSCGSWSACSEAGSQSRSCTDANACGTTANRPALTQSCAIPDGTAPAMVTNLTAS